MSTVSSQAALPQRKLRWYQYRLRSLLILVTVWAIACSWLAVRRKHAEDERKARLQALVATARNAQREWEESREVNRKVPGTVTASELRRLQLQSERAHLDVERVRTEQRGQEAVRALDTRRAIMDLELARLEIEWAQITSSWAEAQRLEPARQAAVRAIRLLRDVGPEAKAAVPLLVAALDDPELEGDARSALERIDPAALKGKSR